MIVIGMAEEKTIQELFFERRIAVKFSLYKSDIIGFETPIPLYVEPSLSGRKT